MQRLELPPYTLHEMRTGSGSPVALVHGLSGSSRWWERNVPALAAKHLVGAIDLIGFGEGRRFFSRPEMLPSFEETSALLARWLETFGGPVHLVGHSMGGQLAIRLAAERPDLVRSLLLVDAAGMPLKLRPLEHMRPLPKFPFGGPRIARVLLPDLLRAGPASVAVASARVLRGDMRAAMHAVAVPTLLVWGENDPLVPLRYGEAMQREIPGARLVVLPRAAHVAMWDAPEEFNRVALAFFAEVEAGGEQATTARGAFAWGISGSTGGIVHRQTGRARDVVLVHGLGMSSAYFSPLARALFARGWSPIAPDLPGFGESGGGDAEDADGHARILAKWADAVAVRNAVWIGHSIGCSAVAALAVLRPDLVRRSVHVGPLWTGARWPTVRLMAMLALDGLREPPAVYGYVIPAYWRAGFVRWWKTGRRYIPGLRREAPLGATFVAGERDPIPDRRRVGGILTVPGAHACIVSHAEEVAAVIGPADEAVSRE